MLEFQHVRYVHDEILILKKKYGGFPVDSGMSKVASGRIFYPQTPNQGTSKNLGLDK